MFIEIQYYLESWNCTRSFWFDMTAHAPGFDCNSKFIKARELLSRYIESLTDEPMYVNGSFEVGGVPRNYPHMNDNGTIIPCEKPIEGFDLDAYLLRQDLKGDK